MVRNPKKEKPSGNRPFTMISEAEKFENELKSKLQSRMIDTEEYDDWYENVIEYLVCVTETKINQRASQFNPRIEKKHVCYTFLFNNELIVNWKCPSDLCAAVRWWVPSTVIMRLQCTFQDSSYTNFRPSYHYHHFYKRYKWLSSCNKRKVLTYTAQPWRLIELEGYFWLFLQKTIICNNNLDLS